MARRDPLGRCGARGFTLVEVLVALFILSVLALMAWRGLDALVRTRDGVRQRHEEVMSLQNALGQWERDLQQIQGAGTVPALRFDGASLWLTRRAPSADEGLQVVCWTVRDGLWLRWASAPATEVRPLHEAWNAAQAWARIAPQALPVLEGAQAWQVYYYRDGDNQWTHALSTGTRRRTDVGAAVPPPPARGASDAEDGGTPPAAPAEGALREDEELPQGLRLVLNLPRGPLTRDLRLPSQP